MADNEFTLQIVSPDRIFYEGQASMVELKTSEGEIGVYAGHIPMTQILSPGVIHIVEPGGGDKHAALHDGFLEILPDKITILAEMAEWPDEIDLNRANEAKIRAERHLSDKNPGVDLTRAEIALHRAMARIELVQKYK